MASSQQALVFSSLLVLLLAFYLAESRTVVIDSQMEMIGGNDEKSVMTNNPTIDCGGACKVRCSRSSRPNLCKRACGSCCAKCQCVPPGTYGNHAMCPCYAALTTRGGKLKCP
ncbi:hypothetical protein J5N97_029045 [Dioscorea zingiberensis]|uniref:Uncharacterized protein n=1 Tax=Dioscorea zingiberensis TaxID=325984 RepID=A0A9D5C0J1_9LILI|nr:hypothetical protein J5N97_029045 [Dioscorea zingiberensis]